jgi:ribonuclease VapC
VIEFVLDSSALLALIHNESGGDRVEQMLDTATMSAVNLSEVVAKLAELGLQEKDISTTFGRLGFLVGEFDESAAIQCGLLRLMTKRLGLSLGDRACLALAASMKAPAVTADRKWLDLDIGVHIVSLR